MSMVGYNENAKEKNKKGKTTDIPYQSENKKIKLCDHIDNNWKMF